MEHPGENNELKLWEDAGFPEQVQDPKLMRLLMKGANNVLDVMLDYKQLMFAESSAMKIIRTKLEILDTEFKMTHNRDPIHSIQTRLKSQASILQKMSRRGIEPTTENMERYISDIAGVRVICGYMDDIYTVEKLLIEHEDIELLERKDYILSPKPSGYRSLHLIVQVPVFLPGGVRKTKVEVQLRTIAMDFWASLEHEIRYKKDLDNKALLKRLETCAEVIARTDEEMQAIRVQMEAQENPTKEMEQILEKLRRFDVPLG
ncbi:MAG: GTP pyrophosphokinase family protein [Clostridiales bacterium]|nr:GTP pyrophosphokinase family protein [Clostridia bacterium]MCR4882872.1 GTP pyrophosphokinase family protein [Clostridiales bacterium]